MITDRQTNFVYLSPLLEKLAPHAFKHLTYNLNKKGVPYGFLPQTKDVWAVDYMPIQVEENYFLQYKFDPDYYNYKKYEHQRTDPYEVWDELALNKPFNRESIKMDGGNIVKCKDKVIVTTKVFKENPGWQEHLLIKEICAQLRVKQVIVIPREPGDSTGHSDGMVRFIDENTVFVNKYPDIRPYKDFGTNLRWSLKNAGLDYVECPYTSWNNKGEFDATGCYMNFLEVGDFIFMPVFGLHEDMLADIQFQHAFPDRMLVGIDCSDLAKHGGVLNCITWNILK
jgi:agmatine deiminase